MKPTLVIMAAGMGSRYGGLKQLDEVGQAGEAIMDYSIYDAVKAGFGKVVFIIRRDFEQAFAKTDVLLSPTSPSVAFKAGDKTDDPLSMYLSDLMTIPVNLAGLPGMSLPCGFDQNGLPIGLQIIGNVLREDQIFHVAHAYEQSTDWHQRSPQL